MTPNFKIFISEITLLNHYYTFTWIYPRMYDSPHPKWDSLRHWRKWEYEQSISPLPQRHRHVGSPLHGKSDGIDSSSASAILFNLWWIIEHSDCTICCREAEYNRLSQTRFRSSLFRNHSMNAQPEPLLCASVGRVWQLVSFLFCMLLSCRRQLDGIDCRHNNPTWWNRSPDAETLSTNCGQSDGIDCRLDH